MPYINVNLSQELTLEKKEVLKSEIGKILNLIGKSEQHLMVDVEDGKTMYFKGKKESCAYIDVRIYGACGYELKDKFTRALFDVIEKVAGIKKDNIFVTVQEFANWGMNGGLV